MSRHVQAPQPLASRRVCTSASLRAGAASAGAFAEWDFDPLNLRAGSSSPGGNWGSAGPSSSPGSDTFFRMATGGGSAGSSGGSDGMGEFMAGPLPKKIATVIGLLVLSRVGVYIPLEGVDRAAFAEKISQSGLLGYIDTLAGGSISKVPSLCPLCPLLPRLPGSRHPTRTHCPNPTLLNVPPNRPISNYERGA